MLKKLSSQHETNSPEDIARLSKALLNESGNGRKELYRASIVNLPWFKGSRLLWMRSGVFIKKENGNLHRLK